jgi:hypothetical protein
MSRKYIWKEIEPNKWVMKISNTNFMLMMISLIGTGYQVKYIDCEFSDYTSEEIDYVKILYHLDNRSKRLLALKISEYYNHYEWNETVNDRISLLELLRDQTSFDISLIKKLVWGETA